MSRDLRLLLVEDSDADGELVLRELRRGGFRVAHRRVDTRSELLTALNTSTWDLVISDYAMPNFSGMDALLCVRSTGSDLPFIIVSGTIGEEVAVTAMRAGAQDYLLREQLTRLVPAVERELRDVEVRQERRRAEVALRDNERRYRLLVESVGAIPWESTLDGQVIYIGPQAERLLGHSMGRWYEHGFWRRLVHPDDLDHVLKNLEQALTSGDHAEMTYRLRTASGTWRWFLDIAAAVADGEGQRVIRGFLVDVTDEREGESRRRAADSARRSLENQLQHAQKLDAIGTLAGGIAHDFNNILTSIAGYAQLLERTMDAEHKSQRYLGGIQTGTKRAQDLVRQILTFSQRQEPQIQAIQVEQVVDEAVQLLRASIPSTIAMDIRLGQQLPAVLADPGQIHQVVMNLGTNAFHAMQATGGMLTVRVTAQQIDTMGAGPVAVGRWVVIEVTDTGCGMNEQVRKRIFEPFFTTKPTGQGTGLGLAVVHGIVESHNGTLTVDSIAGQGSTFRVWLPAISTGSVSNQTATPPLPLGTGQGILLVDDEEPIRQLAIDFLAMLGYRGATAHSPAEAIALVRAEPHRFAVVITDLTMPGMTGIQLANELALINPRLPVLLSSGDLQALDHSRQHVPLAGVLPKPYTIEALGAALRAVIGQR